MKRISIMLVCVLLFVISGCTGNKQVSKDKAVAVDSKKILASEWCCGVIAGGIEHEKSFLKFYDRDLKSIGDVPINYEMLGRGRFGQSVIKDHVLYEYSEETDFTGKGYIGRIIAFNLLTGETKAYEADGNFVQDFCIVDNDIYTVGNTDGDTTVCKISIVTGKVDKIIMKGIASCWIRNVCSKPCIIVERSLYSIDFQKKEKKLFYKFPKEWQDYSVNFYGQSQGYCYVTFLNQVYVFNKKGFVSKFTIEEGDSKLAIVKGNKLYIFCETKEENSELIVYDTKLKKEISKSRLEHSVLNAVINDNVLITLEDQEDCEHLTKCKLDMNGNAQLEKDINIEYDKSMYSLMSLY